MKYLSTLKRRRALELSKLISTLYVAQAAAYTRGERTQDTPPFACRYIEVLILWLSLSLR